MRFSLDASDRVADNVGAMRRGLMTPPDHPGDRHRHLMRAQEGAFDGFDVHVELVRVLWCAAGVLSLVLFVGAKLGW